MLSQTIHLTRSGITLFFKLACPISIIGELVVADQRAILRLAVFAPTSSKLLLIRNLSVWCIPLTTQLQMDGFKILK